MSRMNDNGVRVISMTGGKGGVGKSTLSINLAMHFAKQKKRVLLFDADLGLANIDIMLGIKATKNIHHVLKGECSLEEVCIEGPNGVTIIPSASGMQYLTELSPHESAAIIQSFSQLAQQVDILIVDTAAGITSQVLQFAYAAQDVVMVVCDDPASLADTYAMIKLLHQQYHIKDFWILPNKIKDNNGGNRVFEKIHKLAERFLGINLKYLGDVPYDDHMSIAVKRRSAIIDEFPGAKASMAIGAFGDKLLNWNDAQINNGSITYFFERMLKGQEAEV